MSSATLAPIEVRDGLWGRYREAYSVATSITSFGKLVQTISVVVGGLILFFAASPGKFSARYAVMTTACLLAPVASVLLLVLASVTLGLSQTVGGVLTEHNDNARTGQNLNETVLTPLNVNAINFGKLFSYSVDGQIYAQPLYVPNVAIPGQGTHNVVYATTENDSVYAFDADGLSSTPLWQDSFISPAQGITPVSCQSKDKSIMSCAVYPIYGITGTPVIDPSTNSMYLVARTLENGKYFQRLHALDITTGAEKFGGPGPHSGVGTRNR